MLVVMGVESEYVIVRFPSRRKAETTSTARRLMSVARNRLTNLPGRRDGIFLTSGARFYIDAADHPEWCTAECTSPTDVVCQVRAGERHLGNLLRQMPGAILLRGNVSYLRPCATWGSHESYGHQCPRSRLRQVLRPHLLTRIVYTGSGGLDPLHPGIRFCLSPRSMHFDRRHSTLHAATCLDGRNESLACRPHRRAHVVLGETVCLDLPLWLRVATTSLLVLLANQDLVAPADVPALDEPAAALRAIALDPSLAAPAGTAGSGRSALEIQRSYLELVAKHLHRRVMPDWAPLACTRWRAVLDALTARGPGAVECAQWALKYQIMTRYLNDRGLDWEQLEPFNRVAEQALARPAPAPGPLGDLGFELWARAHLEEWVTTEARKQGFRPQEIQRILAARRDLAEIDMRFDMAPGGIVEALRPQIDGGVPEITEDRIRDAMTVPPQDTRAAVRGRYIRRLSADRRRYGAGWAGIQDRRTQLFLDLSDPFCRRARWKKAPRASADERLLPCGGTIPPIEMA